MPIYGSKRTYKKLPEKAGYDFIGHSDIATETSGQ